MPKIFAFLRRLFSPPQPLTLSQKLLAIHILNATPSRRL